ncbi:MAG: YgiQ family radical SAM protein, partial [Planctomycetes bacterium]|nr:YgiQ family radical SAM protein [Planctomycetota bacterium]
MRVPRPAGSALPFLPMTRAEMDRLGWERPDVLFVSGDAYVDHPSFAMAVLCRVLEAAGFRAAILSQPDWRSAAPFRALGRPRLFSAVSAGNMDSMLNHYTAQKKPRSDDAYSPGGVAGLRRCREAHRGVPVIAGGVEASLRRFAHYDYWSDAVRPSILVSSKADLLVYGMGEAPLVEIARRLDRGATLADLRDLRGVAYLLGAGEELPPLAAALRAAGAPADGTLELPSCEAVRHDPRQFALATRQAHLEMNPLNGRRLVQRQEGRLLVANPPSLPLSEAEMDAVYALPYARRPHPSYTRPIPAAEMMRTSITIQRGCFGGCSFCSLTAHQGRSVQSRSAESVLAEVRALARGPGFAGVVSDLGGPTANMYAMRCARPEVERACRRLSCLHPTPCRLLAADHGPLLALMRAARSEPGVRQVLIASGVRMDLANRSPEYIEELAAHHVGGHLKVAPEHVARGVLDLMRKPRHDEFARFGRRFAAASARAGKEQYLVPYFIAGHPGATLESMIELALFLKRSGFRPRQVQD